MDVAIITNADAPLGQSMAGILWKLGFRVHCLGEDFSAFEQDDEKYSLHQSARGRLSDLNARLEEILAGENGRLDLLLTLTGTPLGLDWETLPAGEIVRRANGHLLESLLAIRVCLKSLLATRGYLMHCSQQATTEDLLAGSLRRIHDGLFAKYRDRGLRVTRLSVMLEADLKLNPILEEAAARYLEQILQSPETTLLREAEIRERLPAGQGKFPDLTANPREAFDPRLPDRDKTAKEDEVLIPTERPRVWIQLAEVEVAKDFDPYPGDEEEREEEAGQPATAAPENETSRRRSRGRNRRRRGRREENGSQEAPADHGNRPSSARETAPAALQERPESSPATKPSQRAAGKTPPKAPEVSPKKRPAGKRVSESSPRKAAARKVAAKKTVKKKTEPTATPGG